MKKGIFVCLALAGAVVTQAQIRVGLYGSATLSKASFTKESDLTITSKPVFAPAGGVVVDIPLSEEFSIRPSLGFIRKGVKAKAVSTDAGITSRMNSEVQMNYQELSVIFTYKKQLGNANLLIGAGPSAGYGLGGKVRTTSYIDPIPTPFLSFEANPYKKSDHIDDPFKRFELSGSALLGVEFNNGLFFTANYLHGFTNISGSAPGDKFRNRTASISVGYFFGGRKG